MKVNFFSENFELPGLATDQVVRVRQGSTFELELTGEGAVSAGWWADEDPVLTISKASRASSTTSGRFFKAEAVGKSEVLIFGAKEEGAQRPLLFTIYVEVFSSEAQSFSTPSEPIRERL